MKISLNNSQSNFRGNIIISTHISKKAKKTQKFLTNLLEQKHNGKNFKEIMKEMPFDAYISCKNPTKKAINPCLTVYLTKEETKTQVGLFSLTNLKSNKPNEIERMHGVLSNFAQACEENKNRPPLTRKENIITIENLIYRQIYSTKHV